MLVLTWTLVLFPIGLIIAFLFLACLVLVFSDRITNSSVLGLSGENFSLILLYLGWGWKPSDGLRSSSWGPPPLTSLPQSGAHISCFVLCQSATKSFCSHLEVRYRKSMALRVLFHNLFRRRVELSHLWLWTFSRSSVDTGNDILIPVFYMKLGFCFFLWSFWGLFFCRYGSDISQIWNFTWVYSLLPSAPVCNSLSSVSGACIFLVVICFLKKKHLFVCLFVSVYVWAYT